MSLFQPPDGFVAERTYSFSTDNLDDDDDVYWDAYNALGDIPASSGPSIKASTPADGEDAYWAQYSTIQGSADSTIPSPRPPNRMLQPQSESDQRVFIPSLEFKPDLSQSEVYNPLAPPSPSCLTRRLAGLPIRPDSPPLQDNSPSASASATSPSPQSPQADLVEDAFVVLEPNSGPDTIIKDAAADEALKHTIRGLYRLWNPSSKSQQSFLALVQHAIDDDLSVQ